MAVSFLKEKVKIFLKKSYPEMYLRLIYYRVTGELLHLKNPIKFNEKIQWLKLYDYPINKLVIKCTDKYRINEYLKDKEIENINASLLGCWDSFDEIDFKILPNRFLLKTNNASGTNFFCENKNKLEFSSLKSKFDEWLEIDFGESSLEKHYSSITPKIIAEEYLEFSEENIEYNFYCFNGTVRFCKVVSFDDKELKIGRGRCYDTDWNELPFDYDKNRLARVNKPPQYDYMLRICKNIAKDFDFVRIDFFQCVDKVVLGELTFSPASGFATAFNKFAQKEMGGWLKLDKTET